MIKEGFDGYEAMKSAETERCKRETKEKNKIRQRKHCQAIYVAEIGHGVRSPGGTKRKVKVSTILASAETYSRL